jgi:hypothetical protein
MSPLLKTCSGVAWVWPTPDKRVIDEETAEERNAEAWSSTVVGRRFGTEVRRYVFLVQSTLAEKDGLYENSAEM